MKKGSKILFCILLGLLLMGSIALAQEDAKDVRITPFFQRCPIIISTIVRNRILMPSNFLTQIVRGRRK